MREDPCRAQPARQAFQAVIRPRRHGRAHDARLGDPLGEEPHPEAVGVEALRHLLGLPALPHQRMPRAVEQVSDQDRLAVVGDEAAHEDNLNGLTTYIVLSVENSSFSVPLQWVPRGKSP